MDDEGKGGLFFWSEGRGPGGGSTSIPSLGVFSLAGGLSCWARPPSHGAASLASGLLWACRLLWESHSTEKGALVMARWLRAVCPR